MTAPDLSAIRAQLAGISNDAARVDQVSEIVAAIEEIILDKIGANVLRSGMDGSFTLAGGQVARLIDTALAVAAAPSTVARLLGIVDDILAISDIGMNSEHGDPAFIQGWECALEEVKARIESAGKES